MLIMTPRVWRRIIVIAAALVVLWVAPRLIWYYTEWLWFGEVGYRTVFWNRLWASWALGLAAGALFFLLVMGNALLARRLASRTSWYEQERRFRQEVAEVLEYYVSRYLGHSRWFDEGGSEAADPTINGYADSSHNSGTLTGVGRIWAPSAYRTPLTFVSAFLRGHDATAVGWYPADFVVTWGAGGSVDVRDVTHNVNIPASTASNTGYGFMNLSNVLATGIDQAGFSFEFDLTGSGVYNILNYQLLLAVEPACSDYWGVVSFDCIELSPTAELSPLDFESDGVLDAMGVIFVLNGETFFMEMNALPAAGTQWHLRAVAGVMTADCTPSLGATMTDCNNYTFEPNPNAATAVPGLRYVITVQQQFAVNPNDSVDLDLVHTVPDPYYVTNAMEITTNRKVLKWVNLPAQAIIRVYSLSGVLVNIIEHNDAAGGGEVNWDLRNRNNQFVASGVYFYHIETPSGQTKIGRFTVVNFAQ